MSSTASATTPRGGLCPREPGGSSAHFRYRRPSARWPQRRASQQRQQRAHLPIGNAAQQACDLVAGEDRGQAIGFARFDGVRGARECHLPPHRRHQTSLPLGFARLSLDATAAPQRTPDTFCLVLFKGPIPSCQDRWALAAQSTGGFHDPDGDRVKAGLARARAAGKRLGRSRICEPGEGATRAGHVRRGSGGSVAR
jgi:hypothetical protein